MAALGALLRKLGPSAATVLQKSSLKHGAPLYFARGGKTWMPDKEFFDQFKGPVMYPDAVTSSWTLPAFNEKAEVHEKQVQNITLNFGPQHPAAHGVLRLVLTLDGETVVRGDPHIG